jgi:hypothetical protein
MNYHWFLKILLFVACITPFGLFANQIVLNNKIYVNSIPKCGTHLLTSVIELMTGLKKHNTMGDMVTGNKLPKMGTHEFPYFHVKYSVPAASFFERNKFRCFFIYRDPRDEVVSYAYWHFIRSRWKDKMNFPQVMNQLIDGVAKQYNAFLPWMKHPQYYSVRFESLVGRQGWGTRQAQLREIRNIASHIGFKITPAIVNHICKNAFGQGGTFREGKIGSWREHFTEAQKNRFKKVAGKLLITLGYEKDLNW